MSDAVRAEPAAAWIHRARVVAEEATDFSGRASGKPRCYECNKWLSKDEAHGIHRDDLRCHRCQEQAVQRMIASTTPTEVRYYQALLGEWVEGLIEARVSELTVI